MILQVMAVYDKKARAYLTPFFVSHIDIATRSFKQASNTAGHQVNAHPEDFALWHLGTFNDENAVFKLCMVPVHIAEAAQLKGVISVQNEVAPE